ncbi:MAG: fructosamine kinase family protein [Candidatus Sericytochromatia bacterium]
MSLPAGLRDLLASGLDCEVGESQLLTGGAMHPIVKVASSRGELVVKWDEQIQRGHFEAEHKGLTHLAAHARLLRIPRVVACLADARYAALVVEYVRPGHGFEQPRFWQALGEGLADLHRQTTGAFGFEQDNFIGLLPQSNRPHTRWADFFAQERLAPMLQHARERDWLDWHEMKQASRLLERLPDLIPEEPPALLHGDLWSGNLLSDAGGQPTLIDPAVYYGHREAELAFTRLFGGFAADFYASYQAAFPLQEGWRERIDLFNLYPLLVHLLLFGRSYLVQVQAVLRRYA